MSELLSSGETLDRKSERIMEPYFNLLISKSFPEKISKSDIVFSGMKNYPKREEIIKKLLSEKYILLKKVEQLEKKNAFMIHRLKSTESDMKFKPIKTFYSIKHLSETGIMERLSIKKTLKAKTPTKLMDWTGEQFDYQMKKIGIKYQNYLQDLKDQIVLSLNEGTEGTNEVLASLKRDHADQIDKINALKTNLCNLKTENERHTKELHDIKKKLYSNQTIFQKSNIALFSVVTIVFLLAFFSSRYLSINLMDKKFILLGITASSVFLLMGILSLFFSKARSKPS